MYNDLIFPILPRNAKIPVDGDNRIQRIRKVAKTESLNQDEKEQRYEVHSADEAELMEHHRRVQKLYGDSEKGRNMSDRYDQRKPAGATGERVSTAQKATDKPKRVSGEAPGRKHLDIFI